MPDRLHLNIPGIITAAGIADYSLIIRSIHRDAYIAHQLWLICPIQKTEQQAFMNKRETLIQPVLHLRCFLRLLLFCADDLD
ncbi:hypothetical protein D3C76_1779850 [compost metagenome]